jgi:hypothetical protein
MFVKPLQVLRVLVRFLFLIAPFLFVIFVFSAGTELTARGIPLQEFVRLQEFWPAILRNMLPSLFAMFAAYWLAARFLKEFYDLESLREAALFLWRWRFGQVRFSPYQRIQQGKIDKGEDGILARVGGPGHLVIHHDSEAVLSRAGQITRLEGPKFPALESFEKVYRVVDLQPKRAARKVTALTREGIPISCEVDIRYQIRHEWNEKGTPKRPFPASRRHVLRAATSTWKCDPFISESGELDWEARLTFAPLGILRSIFARYSLDQLIQPMGWEGDELLYREEIGKALLERLHASAGGLGAEVLGVHLGDIEIRDDGVTKQWLEAWRAKWESQLAQRRAEGEAEATEQVGTARAQAQAEIVVNLTQSLQALASSSGALQSRLGLLRVVAILRHMAHDPQTEPFLPVEALHDLIALQEKVGGLGQHQG